MGTRDHLQNETQKRDRTKIRPTFTLTHFSKPKSLHKSISSCRRYHSIAASPLVFGAGQFCSFIRLQLSAPENDTRLMMYDIQASPFHVVASAAGVTLEWIEYFRFKRIKKAFFSPDLYLFRDRLLICQHAPSLLRFPTFQLSDPWHLSSSTRSTKFVGHCCTDSNLAAGFCKKLLKEKGGTCFIAGSIKQRQQRENAYFCIVLGSDLLCLDFFFSYLL